MTAFTTTDPTTARIALSFIVEPGNAEVGRFIADHGPVDALAKLPGTSIPGTGRRPSETEVDYALKVIERERITVLTPEGDGWPSWAGKLRDTAPIILFVKGDPTLLTDGIRAGVIGARAATMYGETTTQEITADLVSRGATIVSGAAYGVDGMAHRSALAADGKTIALLAGGVDRPYPAGHDQLIHRIGQHGAVVSELPPGTQPTKWRFLSRNRLIAAASDVLVITEAGMRSGSLTTAACADALNIPVTAVPGPITSVSSAGCHRVIREGVATLVTTGEEVWEAKGE
ncbi:DNA-processing protein DprA [Leifsonia sp. Leaf264]|uniref:DNA-processing protein DprA n=1 Tax=Leifsonia sp. Leaf264 TaxID=1736314 RepID=UPI0006F47085|nr:DNA-processing protein DprA [Leifsonia sp. Leaf264]KQO98532.1 hypothetical protein ASF30_10750 [Leifsonia sp. Leaf264]